MLKSLFFEMTQLYIDKSTKLSQLVLLVLRAFYSSHQYSSMLESTAYY